jgi:hypothetical protein
LKPPCRKDDDDGIKTSPGALKPREQEEEEEEEEEEGYWVIRSSESYFSILLECASENPTFHFAFVLECSSSC